MKNGFQNLLVRGLGQHNLLGGGLATLLRDPHKAVSSIITVTILCLIVISAPQADETETGEIIESDFAPATAPLSSDDQTSQDSLTNLPAVEPSLLAVPDNLIDDRPPEVARRAGNGSSGGGGSGDSGGSNGGSGASGSGGGSGDSGGSSGGGGSGDSGGSNGGSGASDSSGGSGDSGGSSDGGGKGKGKGKGGKGGKGGKNK